VHCEGAITRMLFGIFFWDIIFSPVPGAFETPYQTAPLDIAEDTFMESRKTLIAKRLSELEENPRAARSILDYIDSTHRPQQTVCVGVRWDRWSAEDLQEIVDVRAALRRSGRAG
jgi:Fanconi-associated nuclease 1